MEFLPLDDLENIINFSDPDSIVSFCTSSSKTLRANCETIIRSKLRNVDLSSLPYRPNNILELYVVYQAIYGSSKVGSQLVNPFYAAIMAIKWNDKENFERAIGELSTIDNDMVEFIAKYERYDFLELLPSYDEKWFFAELLTVKDVDIDTLKKYEVRAVSEIYDRGLTPIMVENLTRLETTFHPKVKLDSTRMIEYYYSINDVKSIEKYGAEYFISWLHTKDEFAALLKKGELYFGMIIDLWKWNRWDLWNILLDYYNGQIPTPEQINPVNTEWMSSFSLPRALNMYPHLVKNEGKINAIASFLEETDEETSLSESEQPVYAKKPAIKPNTKMREYYRFCRNRNIRPYLYISLIEYNVDDIIRNPAYMKAVEITINSVKTLTRIYPEDIITGRINPNYFISSTKLGKIMQSLAEVDLAYKEIYYGVNPRKDKTVASLLFKKSIMITNESYKKYYKISAQRNDFRPLVYWLESNDSSNVVLTEPVSRYYLTKKKGELPRGVDEFNKSAKKALKNRPSGPDSKALERIENNKFLALKFVFVNQGIWGNYKIKQVKFTDKLFDYIAMDLVNSKMKSKKFFSTLDKLSNKALSQVLPMTLTVFFNRYNMGDILPSKGFNGNFKKFTDYMEKNKDRLTLDIESFITYYPAICLVGLSFLLQIFPASQVNGLLQTMLASKFVPQHTKDFIRQYL